MEGVVDAQGSHSIFVQPTIPPSFCQMSVISKKRDSQRKNNDFQKTNQMDSLYMTPSKGVWHSEAWNWNNITFVATPNSEIKTKQKKTVELNENDGGEEYENLTLKLGGGSYSDQLESRPNKRVRSGSPGNGNHPMCQVDMCREDLSNAKDYHRRHKVCEIHSKILKALVGNQMQRFCQQCSRFHLLMEFDEGKRSCRRRLAGHNRRRRKNQPEVSSAHLLLSNNQENNPGGNLDIANILSILSQLQGKTGNSALQESDKGHVAMKSSPLAIDLNIPLTTESHFEQSLPDDQSPSNVYSRAIPPVAFATSSKSPSSNLFKGSNASTGDGNLNDKMGFYLQSQVKPVLISDSMEKNNETLQSPIILTKYHHTSPSPLQLFNSSSDNDSPSIFTAPQKYFTSDSSNLMDSPISSPPHLRKLFPISSSKKMMNFERNIIPSRGDREGIASTSDGSSSPLELFKTSGGKLEDIEMPNIARQAGFTSSSESFHSLSSSSSEAEVRTEKITIKLFDKDPSSFPENLQHQILKWLSNSPLEMESYIRPGCVVLSIYASFPSIIWQELQENFLHYVSSLIEDTSCDFWRNARFLVHNDRQLASYKNGKIRLSKSWRSWSSPKLIYVSPLAVTGGTTTLLLKGYRLASPGTKFHCTCMGGGYTTKVVLCSSNPDTTNDLGLANFSFCGFFPNVLGRCFLEVENGLKGNSFPLIIADDPICQELRTLEPVFENMIFHVTSKEMQDSKRSMERLSLHFLNELGWLFQRKSNPNSKDVTCFTHSRFKFLLTFSMERDWHVLVKTILDIYLETNHEQEHGLSSESIKALSEIHLLNMAVRRKCKNMVVMLLNYSLKSTTNSLVKYIFTPNQAGPCGITPLHLAACTEESKDIIDLLTSDPQQIGIKCWNSILDTNGLTPYTYASMRDNNSYNEFVDKKLREWKNNQVSITISESEISEQLKLQLQPRQGKSCSLCTTSVLKRANQMHGMHGLLHRPYVHSMLTIATVCVCVCILFRGSPDIGSIAPFKWEIISYGIS